MSDVSAALRDEVALRAGDRCEYCGLTIDQAAVQAIVRLFVFWTQVIGHPAPR